MRFRPVFAVVAAGYLVMPAIAENQSSASLNIETAAKADGTIALPDVNFRRDWTSLGSFVVNGSDGEGAEGIHVVYTQPGVANAYAETGKFPDGTILIKELLTAKTEDLTTGTISYADAVEGWFIMIKDTKGRFPNNPLWGDGWGWGFFEAADPANLITMDYKSECRACHVPAKSTDWIYVRGYPALNN